MVAITEERGKKGASRKEKREGKERRIVEGKLPRHRVVANGINFRDFSSLCGLHMAVNINRFSPGEFPSPGPCPQKIYDNSDVPPCERKNRAEKWRGKREKKRGERGKQRKSRSSDEAMCVAPVAAQFRVKTLLGLISLCSGVERMRATIPRYDNRGSMVMTRNKVMIIVGSEI